MAKTTQKSLELAELIRCSDVARFQISQAHLQLKQKLDIPLRIRNSLKASPLKWLGGSVAAGFVGSLLFRSKRKQPKLESGSEKKSRGWFFALLMMLFTLVKPTLKIFASKILKDYLQNQMSRRIDGGVPSDSRDAY
jgi:hypothetical protein